MPPRPHGPGTCGGRVRNVGRIRRVCRPLALGGGHRRADGCRPAPRQRTGVDPELPDRHVPLLRVPVPDNSVVPLRNRTDTAGKFIGGAPFGDNASLNSEVLMEPIGTRLPVVIDTDPGVDDAWALLYLAAQPDVEIVAVGAIHGNVPTAVAAENALRILEVAGLADVPVAAGPPAPLQQPLEAGQFVHGQDGLCGHAGPPALASARRRTGSGAAGATGPAAPGRAVPSVAGTADQHRARPAAGTAPSPTTAPGGLHGRSPVGPRQHLGLGGRQHRARPRGSRGGDARGLQPDDGADGRDYGRLGRRTVARRNRGHRHTCRPLRDAGTRRLRRHPHPGPRPPGLHHARPAGRRDPAGRVAGHLRGTAGGRRTRGVLPGSDPGGRPYRISSGDELHHRRTPAGADRGDGRCRDGPGPCPQSSDQQPGWRPFPMRSRSPAARGSPSLANSW